MAGGPFVTERIKHRNWYCPSCGERLTLAIPAIGIPWCTHGGKRATKPCDMVPVEDPE